MCDLLVECCQCHAEMCKGCFQCCGELAKDCDKSTCNIYGNGKSKNNAYKPIDTPAPMSAQMTRDIPLVF